MMHDQHIQDLNDPQSHQDHHVDDYNSGHEPRPKRQKRGKYASKACDGCQRRKIKCDGRVPCRACTLGGRECHKEATDMRRRGLALLNEEVAQSHMPPIAPEANRGVSTEELADRLDRIEQQLSLLVSSASHGVARSNGPEPDQAVRPQGGFTNTGVHSKSSGTRSSHKVSVPTFSGETSIFHTLDQVEAHLNIGARQDANPAASQTTKTSFPSSPVSHGNAIEDREKIYIKKVLSEFDIEPDRRCWDEFLETFCHEIHILYPMLHLPTLRSTYIDMWSRYISQEREIRCDDRFAIAQVWICLAIGRCTQSPRIHGEDGRHSAGWSLYDAAMQLTGELFSSFHECSSHILVLQTLVLAVIYLFRLDANDRAEKLLALAIVHSHQIGLHRKEVVEAISTFDGEMARRLWWCLYTMDRRLAIETGHPFLIQDMNVDTPLPREIGDDWLTSFRNDTRISYELETDIQAEIAQAPLTTIPYLLAMISYSRVVGKVWESMYTVSSTDSPRNLLCDYLEQNVCRAQKEIGFEFVQGFDQHSNLQASSIPWWRLKQRMLMHIRWHSLRLLVRKPMLQQVVSPSNPSPNNLENEIICMNIAQLIIKGFNKIPKEKVRSVFPFLHFFVSATMISLGLIIKQPLFKVNGNATFQAARMLKTYCHKTWISCGMTRTVHRLNHIAARVLDDRKHPGQLLSQQQHPPDTGGYGSMQSPHTPNLTIPVSSMKISAADTHDYDNCLRDRLAPSTQDYAQDRSLGDLTRGLNCDTTNPEYQYPRQPKDWTPAIGNVFMGDFDFEEKNVSNLGQSILSQLWPQKNELVFPVPAELDETSSVMPSEEQLSAAIQQDVQDTREISSVENGWLQSLFWDSIGSYS